MKCAKRNLRRRLDEATKINNLKRYRYPFAMTAVAEGTVDVGASALNLHHKAVLETADLRQRAQTVRAEFRELGRRRLALQEEWRRLRIERTYMEDERRRFEDVRCSPWFQAHALPVAKGAARIKLNVGGQLFETTTETLRRDPESMLAAMAGPGGAMVANGGCFYIDRDWWLFRHILTFLRDGKLPSRRRLLSQLYREADFYNLIMSVGFRLKRTFHGFGIGAHACAECFAMLRQVTPLRAGALGSFLRCRARRARSGRRGR